MSDLKSLSKEAIPAALEKAERYRLLNEPGEAESICLDILETDPENQPALITLLLALDRSSQQRLRGQRIAGESVARADQGGIRARLLRGHFGGTAGQGETRAGHPDTTSPIMNCAKRCGSFKRQNRSGHRATTTRSCAKKLLRPPHDGEK